MSRGTRREVSRTVLWACSCEEEKEKRGHSAFIEENEMRAKKHEQDNTDV